ncbi:MAG: hypothetical protein AABX95_04650 [Nanoarchaeota archaeon]
MKRKEDNLKSDTLTNLTKGQLIEIINKTSDKNEFFKREIEKHLKENKSQFEQDNNYSKYSTLWDESEEIISKFNEYGGGPEDEEETPYNNLPKIVELFNNDKLDKETKKEFINNCFEQYYYGNSGFEDLLRDSVFEVCTTKEDWLFVIDKLKKGGSDYDNERIIGIYKDDLKDDETYLKLRMANLKSGMDYFDLVDYYNKKGKNEIAVNFAKEGIEKGFGRIIDLIDFLLEFYTKNDDYENLLKYKILSFRDSPTFEKYVGIRKSSDTKDKKEVLDEIVNASGDNELKAEVNYFNKNYPPILEYLKSNQEADFIYITRFKEWAQKLEKYFSQDLIKIYLKKVQRILEFKISKEYSAAGYYLHRIKLIYLDKNKKEWEDLFTKLKRKSEKLPSFQKMLKTLEKNK